MSEKQKIPKFTLCGPKQSHILLCFCGMCAQAHTHTHTHLGPDIWDLDLDLLHTGRCLEVQERGMAEPSLLLSTTTSSRPSMQAVEEPVTLPSSQLELGGLWPFVASQFCLCLNSL